MQKIEMANSSKHSARNLIEGNNFSNTDLKPTFNEKVDGNKSVCHRQASLAGEMEKSEKRIEICRSELEKVLDGTSDFDYVKASELRNLEEKVLKDKSLYEKEIKRKEATLSLFMSYIEELRRESALLQEDLRKSERPKTDILNNAFTQTAATEERQNANNSIENLPKTKSKKKNQLQAKLEIYQKISVDQKVLLEGLRKANDQLKQERDLLKMNLRRQNMTLSETKEEQQYFMRSREMLQNEVAALKQQIRVLQRENCDLKYYYEPCLPYSTYSNPGYSDDPISKPSKSSNNELCKSSAIISELSDSTAISLD